MFEQEKISIGNLLLDTSNYRIPKQKNQKDTMTAIIAEQKRKLVALAEDIAKHGLSPFDLPMVVADSDGSGNYVVVEGNRRIAAIMLLLNPERAEGTELEAPFKRLSNKHIGAIPKVIDCTVSPSKRDALIWINRKHGNGLDGAGTEKWSSSAIARAEGDQGGFRADLEVLNFVLSNAKGISDEARARIESASFSMTNLQRLVTTKDLQQVAQLTISNGELMSNSAKDWLADVLKTVVLTVSEKIIQSGPQKGNKFTEREIDKADRRSAFVTDLLQDKIESRGGDVAPWKVTGTSNLSDVAASQKKKRKPNTPTTTDRKNLIPRKFQLSLPSGKINNIFDELKKLDAMNHRYSVSVMFRVFLELTIGEYIKSHQLEDAEKMDKLSSRLTYVKKHAETEKLLELEIIKPINVMLSNPHHWLSTNTLNAYVHSPYMNPDPDQTKIAWDNLQAFFEGLWASINKDGQS